MSRIAGTFRRLAKAGEAALIPYLPAGIPSLEVTRRLLPVVGRQGADLIVIGPTPGIMQAVGSVGPVRAASIGDCLSIAAEARRSNEVPLVLLAYQSDVQEHGAEQLASECAAAGVDALLVPDSSLGVGLDLVEACEASAIDLISPVTSDALAAGLEELSGFVICIADDSPSLLRLVEQVRAETSLPVVVTYFNATPTDVREVARMADGVLVVGSLLRVMEGGQEDEIMLDASEVVRSLKAATQKAAPTR